MARTSTANRALILSHLEKLTRFCSAQAIYAEMKAAGRSIGLATVYRNLQGMAEEGLIDHIQTDSETLYRACATRTHHHHLICRECGETVEITGHTVEQWAKELESETGFTDITHVVEFGGVCPRCSAAAAAEEGAEEPRN